MARRTFLNLPVEPDETSKAFCAALGWKINTQFTDARAASVVISDAIEAVLLTRDTHRKSPDKQFGDASQVSSLHIAPSQDSNKDVHALVDSSVWVGASAPHPTQDIRFMISCACDGIDGRTGEILYMDPWRVHAKNAAGLKKDNWENRHDHAVA